MVTRVCFVLFVAPYALCSYQNLPPIDDATLKEVFGAVGQASEIVPQQAEAVTPVPPVPPGQATPVTPSAQDLLDDDYWDVDEPPSASVADYDTFDWVLTKRVASASDKNFLVSPLGLKLALGVLAEAASRSTKTELSTVLGFGTDRNATRKKFSTIIDSLQKESPQYILNLGSRLFVEENIQPNQRFAATAQQFYNTEIKKVDFQNPLVAAKTINNWVANLTHGKITNLVDPDDVNSLVVMVINTLFFKGTWRHQFSVNDTRDDLFYTTPKQPKTVSFMNVKNKFHFVESARLDAKILRMTYLGNNKFAMYVIVPNTLTGLPRVMAEVDNLRQDLDAMQERFVDVTLPKFKFDYTSHLDELLKDMGVRQVFEDTASLPGISRGIGLKHRLRVSKVLQRSGIEVNELGSTAYTATEISLVNKFGEDEEKVIANKPFFLFIQDEGTRQLLFTGRVTDPELVDGEFQLQ